MGNDNRPVGSYCEKDIQKLEAVKGQAMSCFKSTTFKQVGKWKKVGKGEAISRASTSIVPILSLVNKAIYVILTCYMDCLCVVWQKKNQPI